MRKLLENAAKLKKSLKEKYFSGRIHKNIRKTRAVIKRYLHILRRSGALKFIFEASKAVWKKFSSFNLLNSASLLLSRIFGRLGFRRTASRLEFSMREPNGINRHVLVRYLMKELFLYFFVAFLFFFMVFFVNQILLVAENILKKRVPVMDVARLITYSLPMVIAPQLSLDPL